jgi:N-acetylglucosaminyl-diphospho-decaprenol L-rhamnosyltransferase
VNGLATASMITVSVVSHGHAEMIPDLVRQLLDCPEVGQVVITRNIPEDSAGWGADSRVVEINNASPRGFGANHNAAFGLARGEFYCPVNPDVRLIGNPFNRLLEALKENQAGLAVPLVVTPEGAVEDSIRRFPDARSLALKLIGQADGRYHVSPGQPPFFPEWAAGMFMLFRSDIFQALKGFDDKFFMYYEDVDICARAWKQGVRVVACPQVSVVHDARRDSRRKPEFMRWHLASMVRYFAKHWWRLPRAHVK